MQIGLTGRTIMGYTLVTSFDKLSYEKLNYLLEHQNANKIPFDKKCNREEANKILKYKTVINSV